MRQIIRSGGALLAAALFAAAASAPLSGQGVGLTFVGETAGDDVSLFLAEGGWAAEGLGWRPVVSLQTYIVTYPSGDETGSTWSVGPKVGMRYRMDGGFIQGKVGYSFKGSGDTGATDFFGGGEDGVSTSAHLEWWGTGAYGLQGLASYNFGSDYLWSRARTTARVVESPSGNFNVGVEAGWQGELGDEDPTGTPGITEPNYGAVMVGPLVQWITDNVIGVVGAGLKRIDADVAPEGEESTWYAKVELVLTPRW